MPPRVGGFREPGEGDSHHHAFKDDPPVAETESGGPPTLPGMEVDPVKFDYEPVEGFFLQTGGRTGLDFEEHMLKHSFGLVDKSPERWSNLDRKLKQLNEDARQAGNGVQYKVFFLGRHGQGWHNYGAFKYGIDPWEDYWAMQYGDGEITWGPDPALTPEGIRQAQAVQACWRAEKEAGAPLAAGQIRWLCSPLQRTCQTLEESFGNLLTGRPEIWEDWREILGSHTCDERSTKSVIQERFPGFLIEQGFTEKDELWFADDRETDKRMQIRARRALDKVFSEGDEGVKELYVSVTAHGAILRNTLQSLRHTPHPLKTGEMIPVLVKATPVA